jgi:hypothetical protein
LATEDALTSLQSFRNAFPFLRIHITMLPHRQYSQMMLECFSRSLAKVPAVGSLAIEKWQSIAAIFHGTLHTRPFSSNV